ncbi:Mechanosensitive ion channel [Malonomonas rubra DSM 5091]|uniref:Mechanosensitive ion channel n=1 Tax=Malonomonas rubra DSM 5091 TaxID=1122189 RepID=A0A1M6KRR5_MALRU|nr:mechanosensitive ion channel domain-containing protein [Malonomonas rubra]SHJ61594.1 Mechanosensitive ion channel [Malonomonas rubra DSM 5091]
MITSTMLTPIILISVAAVLGITLDILITRKVKNKIGFTPLSETKYNKFWHTQFKVLLPLAAIILVAPTLPVSPENLPVVRRFLGILFICSATWIALSAVFLGRFFILTRYDMSVSDNLDARTVHTQVNVLVKISVIIIIILASTSVIMMFDSIRQFGASILASAGVLGIVIGFAAQRSIATLLAGLQIALTQPIRIDDVVIVEGEWGQIEEITLTYIVVRIWDLRRLVVPTNYFLEKPFQNWTRTSADLLANATIHVDYNIPVENVRN